MSLRLLVGGTFQRRCQQDSSSSHCVSSVQQLNKNTSDWDSAPGTWEIKRACPHRDTRRDSEWDNADLKQFDWMHVSLLPGLIRHEVRQILFPNHNTARQHHTNISQGSVLWKAFPKHQPQKTAPSSLPWHQEEDWWQQCSGLCLYLGLEQRDGVFTRGCVSHTAQGLNASLTHPCSVNTEATCCCVCVCVCGWVGVCLDS